MSKPLIPFAVAKGLHISRPVRPIEGNPTAFAIYAIQYEQWFKTVEKVFDGLAMANVHRWTEREEFEREAGVLKPMRPLEEQLT
jgi:hypothetical protein